MRPSLLWGSLALLSLSTPSWADDTLRQILSSGATTASTYSTFKDHKLLVAAQEDAGAFVASNGDIRGVHLQAAIEQWRAAHPQQQASDEQLAQALLVAEPGDLPR
ncbi:DUF2388 domain-containing protein [Aquipseudomonas ullengensis]|uniref:DUF2388 domain-containing protein n=1 Tax=Aquipseudomonas ullengensis TaxID=2759166 RepID=A0A7W4LIX5_9GAMM|nr:DUF2388 domain-containing protein [Pseudomonas ullengensis]MBB2493971.1 DUF2388 domain-containing protein [Pseudomonas ullengensis]